MWIVDVTLVCKSADVRCNTYLCQSHIISPLLPCLIANEGNAQARHKKRLLVIHLYYFNQSSKNSRDLCFCSHFHLCTVCHSNPPVTAIGQGCTTWLSGRLLVTKVAHTTFSCKRIFYKEGKPHLARRTSWHSYSTCEESDTHFKSSQLIMEKAGKLQLRHTDVYLFQQKQFAMFVDIYCKRTFRTELQFSIAFK